MQLYKQIFLIAFILTPAIIVSIEVFIYLEYLNYKSISLITSNFIGILPCSLCLYYTLTKQKNMLLEFIPFYLIIFSSGSYHLCNSVNYIGSYCSLGKDFYFTFDFINSYFCITTILLYGIKLEYIDHFRNCIILKRLIYLANLIMLCFLIIKQPNIYLPLIYICCIFGVFIGTLFLKYDLYIDNFYTRNKIIHLTVGIILGIFSFLIYIFTVYKSLEPCNNYWFLHAFFWHIPVITSSMFILETFTENSEHESFFRFCISKFNYKGRNNNRIHIETINNDVENCSIIENFENNN